MQALLLLLSCWLLLPRARGAGAAAGATVPANDTRSLFAALNNPRVAVVELHDSIVLNRSEWGGLASVNRDVLVTASPERAVASTYMMRFFPVVGGSFRMIRQSPGAVVATERCVLHRRAGLPLNDVMINGLSAERAPGYPAQQRCYIMEDVTYRSTRGPEPFHLDRALQVADWAWLAPNDSALASQNLLYGGYVRVITDLIFLVDHEADAKCLTERPGNECVMRLNDQLDAQEQQAAQQQQGGGDGGGGGKVAATLPIAIAVPLAVVAAAATLASVLLLLRRRRRRRRAAAGPKGILETGPGPGPGPTAPGPGDTGCVVLGVEEGQALPEWSPLAYEQQAEERKVQERTLEDTALNSRIGAMAGGSAAVPVPAAPEAAAGGPAPASLLLRPAATQAAEGETGAGSSSGAAPNTSDGVTLQLPAVRKAGGAADVAAALAGMAAQLRASVQDVAIRLEGILGSGSFGIVYTGTWQGLPVAVKTVVFSASQERRRRALQEAALCQSISHPNIIATYTSELQSLSSAVRKKSGGSGAGGLEGGPAGSSGTSAGRYVQDWRLYIVMEYADGGPLGRLYGSNELWAGPERVNLPAILSLALGIARALSHLHSKRIVHGDLNPNNVMLKRTRPSPRAMPNLRMGTMFYICPAVVMKGHVGPASDVFALGVMLWELYHGRPAGIRTPEGPRYCSFFPAFPPSCPPAYKEQHTRSDCQPLNGSLRPHAQHDPATIGFRSAAPQRWSLLLLQLLNCWLLLPGARGAGAAAGATVPANDTRSLFAALNNPGVAVVEVHDSIVLNRSEWGGLASVNRDVLVTASPERAAASTYVLIDFAGLDVIIGVGRGCKLTFRDIEVLNHFAATGPSFRIIKQSPGGIVILDHCVERRRVGLPYDAAAANGNLAPRPPGFPGKQNCYVVCPVAFRTTRRSEAPVTLDRAIRCPDWTGAVPLDSALVSQGLVYGGYVHGDYDVIYVVDHQADPACLAVRPGSECVLLLIEQLDAQERQRAAAAHNRGGGRASPLAPGPGDIGCVFLGLDEGQALPEWSPLAHEQEAEERAVQERTLEDTALNSRIEAMAGASPMPVPAAAEDTGGGPALASLLLRPAATQAAEGEAGAGSSSGAVPSTSDGVTLQLPAVRGAGGAVDDVAAELAGMAAQLRASVQDVAIRLEGILGSGSYGIVYTGTWQGLPVAVKTVVFSASQERRRRALQEAALCQSISHPNIIATYTSELQSLSSAVRRKSGGSGAGGLEGGPAGSSGTSAGRYVQDWRLYIVMEYADGGPLGALYGSKELWAGPERVNLPAILSLALGIARALSHLHSKRIVHGDLNPNNVMLKRDPAEPSGYAVKIGDFGLSVMLPDHRTHLSNLRMGTMFYICPAVVMKGHVGPASDVFALGVMLWELYHGRPAGIRTPEGPRYCSFFPAFPPSCPPAYKEVTLGCLRKHPHKRPTAHEVEAALGACLEGLGAAGEEIQAQGM
ncbi:hypothetical protein HYH03_012568 [Edaphochlamys debaryana]|uniref:Protein kinase domain-containing protein n=1 Tax=Edaphochlamys debaryana TaxID=47281 RepID=A0A836BVF3_9CHLO|nr:hypothetical protein HYH03_012568 [Edaphochlamys debaryana]|eukprot:KAG2488949.1 hypothetical protein HYH03_012568 [Edaphochlamys debaryana]